MDKAEALARILAEPRAVAPGQGHGADRFRPGDAWGVARLFHAIYGEHYPVDTPYVPERLIRANERREVISLVGRTDGGDVVGHYALYQSSPPNKGLYEIGQMLILPDYRVGMLAFRLNHLAMQVLEESADIQGLFGEAVTNHTITQKLVSRMGFTSVGLEPALMPANALEREGAMGRVGCLSAVRIKPGERRSLFVPVRYREQVAFLREGTGVDREVLASSEPFPAGSRTRAEVQRFDFAGVVRMNLLCAGEDLDAVAAVAESGSPALVQAYCNLGEPWCGQAVEALRARGYFLGGYLPLWMGDDALLMQKLNVDPQFEDMALLSERDRAVRDLVRRDRESLPAG